MKTRYTLQNWASKWNTLGKLHEIQHVDCKNIQEFMTKIRDVKSEIEDLEITMDEAITIQVLNSLDSSFAQFLGILSHEAREKDKLPTLENLVKSLEDEELQMKIRIRQQPTTQNGLLRKKVNLLLLKLKTLRILQLAHLQSASSVKKNMGQMSAGIYKQNVTTAMMLAILPSSVRKSHLQGQAHLKILLCVLEGFPLVSINHHTHQPHLALSQASTMSQPLKK